MATLKDINLLDVGHSITMVGALYAGKGRVLAVLFPEGADEAKAAPVEMVDMTHEDWRDRLLPQTDTLPAEVFPDGSPRRPSSGRRTARSTTTSPGRSTGGTTSPAGTAGRTTSP